jgi:GT2 family glycosyltransferase
MNPTISILLAAYNSEDLLMKVFLPGFSKNTNPAYRVQLIIYDNGGNGKLQEVKERCSHLVDIVNVVGDGKNVGLNAALNECAKVADGEYFYLPHTDIYLMPGWDTALMEACKGMPPRSFLLCSRSIEPTKGHTDLHVIRDYGKDPSDFKEEDLLKDFKDYSDHVIVFAARMPFFMHRDLWKKMNGVDPDYFSYCTDDDLIQTAYDVGVRKFWMINNSLIYHLQGKSNAQQTVDKDSNKPYIHFVNKWRDRGYKDANHPGYWHPKLLPLGLKVKG